MNEKLAWGLLATGKIARSFAGALAASGTGRAVAVGSRKQASADRFGDEFNIPRRYGSYEALLALIPTGSLWLTRVARPVRIGGGFGTRTVSSTLY
jgi:hypothetical protein